nr:efflux RND transporter permease subunit [Endozoicomonas sp. SCSIO W0465]
MYQVASQTMDLIAEQLPGAQVYPSPGLEFTAPELRLIPDDRRLSEVGWYRGSLPSIVQSLGEGVQLGEYFDGQESLNIIMRGGEIRSPQVLEMTPLMTPGGFVVPLGELMSVEPRLGPESIRRVDQRRTLTLSISPADGMTLEETLLVIEEKVIPQVTQWLPPGAQLKISGNADSLKQALGNLLGIFLFALLILTILLWGLFRSFRDALLVILTLPLATVGGLLAVHWLNGVAAQPVDLLTMIGFVILLGLVVNNAILLVHQARTGEAAGLHRLAAVEQALLTRMRPIFMTTLTSIFGMFPLLLSPATGSEIYRGLAAVIIGGMTISTLFTLILLPALLRMGEGHNLEQATE